MSEAWFPGTPKGLAFQSCEDVESFICFLTCLNITVRAQQRVQESMPSAARAQLIIDMNRLTCAQFLAMSPQQARIYSAWMSGWFNQKTGYAWVDLNAYERNFANVRQWCTTSPGQTVMEGLKRSTGTL